MIFECVLLALSTQRMLMRKRECRAAAASFFISHSLFFSLVQDILHAQRSGSRAQRPPPLSLPQNLLCKGKSCLITSFFFKNCHWCLRER
jgi:hypothetical protein